MMILTTLDTMYMRFVNRAFLVLFLNFVVGDW